MPMERGKRISYWIATLWLALGMVSTGVVQLMQMEEEVQKFNELGYPIYLMTVLGIWKTLGTIAILVPRYPVLKEWAYAGFFCHVGSGHITPYLASQFCRNCPFTFIINPYFCFLVPETGQQKNITSKHVDHRHEKTIGQNTTSYIDRYPG